MNRLLKTIILCPLFQILQKILVQRKYLLNLQQDYNNVQIKKKNKWKAAFIALEGLFELTLISFRLINFPVTFQIMMNQILRDLINTGEIVSFIDNIIVKIEEEERHNKVVEEVVKRLEKNDLYIKLEKYKWKIKEVEFLEVVI